MAVSRLHPHYNLWDEKKERKQSDPFDQSPTLPDDSLKKKGKVKMSVTDQKNVLIDEMSLRLKSRQRQNVNEVLAAAGISNNRSNGTKHNADSMTEFLTVGNKQSINEKAVNVASIINTARHQINVKQGK